MLTLWLRLASMNTIFTGCWLYHPVPSMMVTPRLTSLLMAFAISSYFFEKMKIVLIGGRC